MNKEFLVEVPNSDGYRVFENMADVRSFLLCHNVNRNEYEIDGKYIRVPKFYDGRQRFMKWKLKECERWGSE